MDALITMNNWSRRILIRNGITGSKIHFVPHPIRHLQKADDSADAWSFVAAGRLTRDKGFDILLEAMSQIKDKRITLSLFLLVDDEHDTYGRLFLDKARQDERVKVMINESHESFRDALPHFGALLIPSRWMETGPLVMFEAMSAGVPVISSALGTPAEVLSSHKDGFLVRPNDAGSWSGALLAFSERSGWPARDGSEPVGRSLDEVGRCVWEVYQHAIELADQPID
jgi:glycosyltransferase involved in cell wall biosynthesis